MIKAKKSLGQNFLIDKNVLEKIVSLIKIENKSILEVGPGTGNLTSYILKNNPKKLIVVEKDKYLARLLKKKFETNVVIINEDILKIDENKLHEDKLIVFGNLPYNISTEILAKWVLNLDNKNFWFDSLILMFQKEVADRIISDFNTKNYGRLTILSNWKLDVEKIFDISAYCFSPRPKVESSLLKFTPKKKYFEIKDAKNLEMITRVFFNQRRKKIKNSFNQIFSDSKYFAEKLNLDLNLRPQNLSPSTYYLITKQYENLRG